MTLTLSGQSREKPGYKKYVLAMPLLAVQAGILITLVQYGLADMYAEVASKHYAHWHKTEEKSGVHSGLDKAAYYLQKALAYNDQYAPYRQLLGSVEISRFYIPGAAPEKTAEMLKAIRAEYAAAKAITPVQWKNWATEGWVSSIQNDDRSKTCQEIINARKRGPSIQWTQELYKTHCESNAKTSP